MGIEKRNYIVWDLETSGTIPEKGHEIVQIGAIGLNYHDLSDHPTEPFQIILKPQHPDKASPEAIKVIGEELWEKAQTEGVHPKVGLRKFLDYINDFNWSGNFWTAPVLTGFNSVRFDEPMLRYWIYKYKLLKPGDEVPWAYYSKDVLHQFTDLFWQDNLTNRKLDTFLEMFGMKREKETHDALEDVKLTAALFRRYMNLMKRVRSRLKIQQEVETTC